MRKISGAITASNVIAAAIATIAFYFALFWGFDAVHILSSANYGLDETWRPQYIFVIGRIFALGPVGLIQVAAFFAALKLATAATCMWHVIDRLRCIIGGRPNSEILEGGLILVVLVSIVAVGPAVWSSNVDLVREAVIQLLLASVAAALCLIERDYEQYDHEQSEMDGLQLDAAEVAHEPILAFEGERSFFVTSAIDVMPSGGGTASPRPRRYRDGLIFNFTRVQFLLWAICGGFAWLVSRQYASIAPAKLTEVLRMLSGL